MGEILKILVPAFLGVVVVFWLLPIRFRFGFLALASFLGIAYLDAIGSVRLLAIATVVYLVAGRGWFGWSHRYTPVVLIGLIIAHLCYFKYLPNLIAGVGFESLVGEVAVPLGISYFSFKLVHFVIEARRQGFEKLSFQQFSCFIYLFPIFTAGPIERYDHFIANQAERLQGADIYEGITRIAYGLIKKFIFAGFISSNLHQADYLAKYSELLEYTSAAELWAIAALTYLYVYFDFSGYCDMAIGASRLFGIRISENFCWPIAATSIVDFWQRWHISLRAWCQSYVYLPVIAIFRAPYLAVFLTFITMGLWHAGSWNYVFWGIYHAAGVAAYQKWCRMPVRKKVCSKNSLTGQIIGIIATNGFICGSHILSTHSSVSATERIRILSKMFFFI
ncbi:MBOAT family O-acyltransferase [Roseiconus lacunae]|uniref:MBOAT family O-acyltransferase n=1 Tax=Roseiconus lacunae TaxID=2605694 RepID=UPI001E558C37|nr:MBOAT family O-acyltransferase [Roseiconus lacunae]MCD0458163.1 hypothetical protein [Roseiconus lacunae]